MSSKIPRKPFLMATLEEFKPDFTPLVYVQTLTLYLCSIKFISHAHGLNAGISTCIIAFDIVQLACKCKSEKAPLAS